MCLKFQTAIQLCMERFFGGWANIVSSKTCIVFWVALVVCLLISKFFEMISFNLKHSIFLSSKFLISNTLCCIV